jgi:bifunctional non-homologous end joining protein LigD
MRRPRWLGLLDAADVRDDHWARPPEPAPPVTPPPTSPPEPADPPPTEPASEPLTSTSSEPSGIPTGPDQEGAVTESTESSSAVSSPAVSSPAVSSTEVRRLEQHFVYNALNTIAALIRTDPAQARELLMGFADLSRAADQAGASTLGRELAAVHGYLNLEQARFGNRLRVSVDVAEDLHPIPVAPMQILAAVRDVVQHDIEPRPEGGLLTLAARAVDDGCEVSVTDGSAVTRTIRLPS